MRLDKKLKKKLLLNAPYVLFVYLFDKAAQGIRLAPGTDASQKLLHLADGFGSAFASPLPSFHPIDLLIGIAGAVIMWVVVYVRGKNAKKFRKNTEYGSARWGTPEDIEPYMDPDFRNNIILTQTERLTMNSRPKDPKTARNKNVLVIGGSGSGKTRFFVKPQLMQLHSSYVVTDPKGSLLVECGRLMEHAGYKIKVFNTINFKKSMHYNTTTIRIEVMHMAKRSPRLLFTEEELETPELQKPIKKAEKAQKKLTKAESKIPKKKIVQKQRVYDPKENQVVTRLVFEETEKKRPSKLTHAAAATPLNAVSATSHRELHEDADGSVSASVSHEVISSAEGGIRTLDTAHRRWTRLKEKIKKSF